MPSKSLERADGPSLVLLSLMWMFGPEKGIESKQSTVELWRHGDRRRLKPLFNLSIQMAELRLQYLIMMAESLHPFISCHKAAICSLSHPKTSAATFILRRCKYSSLLDLFMFTVNMACLHSRSLLCITRSPDFIGRCNWIHKWCRFASHHVNSKWLGAVDFEGREGNEYWCGSYIAALRAACRAAHFSDEADACRTGVTHEKKLPASVSTANLHCRAWKYDGEAGLRALTPPTAKSQRSNFCAGLPTGECLLLFCRVTMAMSAYTSPRLICVLRLHKSLLPNADIL